jgi:GxxExxY protein
MSELLFKDEVYRILGCCFEVHKNLGHGFLEPVYQEALAMELESKSIPFIKEHRLNIKYKDRLLDKTYVADFVCFDKIIIELKAVDTLSASHTAQVLNYLKATGIKLGLLVNFGSSSLQYKRLIL